MNDAPLSVRRIAAKFSGTLGVAAHNLKSGETITLNADTAFPTASMVKIGILLELFRQREAGKLALDDVVVVRKKDKTAGSGLIEKMDPQTPLTLYNLAVLMNAISDNTATNVLIDRLGIGAVNQAMREAGMERTRINRKIVFTPKRKLKYPHFAVGTPRDFMKLMVNLYGGRLLNRQNTERMLTIMKIQKNMGNLTRYLNFNPYGRDAQAWVASKTGSITGTRNETGIIHTRRGAHVVAVMTKGCKDKRWTPDNEGTVAVARVSEALYQRFSAG